MQLGMVRRNLIATTVSVLCMLSALDDAGAQDTSLQAAKQHFDDGQNLYLQSKYSEAAQKFLQAYQLKKFPAFLFNAAVSYEKNRDFVKALRRYEEFILADPHSADRKKVQSRIDTIRSHLNPPKDSTGKVPPTPEVPNLPEIQTKGLVVIESNPEGAAIYLDDRARGVFTRSPYTGSLPPGQHRIELELKGYDPIQKTFIVRNDRMAYLYFALTRKKNLGWVEIKANVPGALIYFDEKDVGAVGKTPYTGHQRPGKRLLIVERDGYEPFIKEVQITAGKTHVFNAMLYRVRYGWLKITGKTTQGAKVFVDGNPFPCSGYPCRGKLALGQHRITLERDGFKTYETDVVINQSEELQMRVRLNPKPSRVNAYITLGVAAALLGAGIGAGIFSKNKADSLQQDLDNGLIYDGDDSRVTQGRIASITANALFGVSALVAILGTYFLFRDVGPDSYGDTQRKNIAIVPSLSPTMAGVSGQVRF